MFKKTMEFCNKGMVQANPLPPSYGQRPYFDCFFWDPSLSYFTTNFTTNFPWHFLYLRETQANVLRGLRQF